jgi:hypothetical protein
LARVLEERDGVCADLYRRAVDTFGEDPLTGSALTTASHCIREFANRLPGVLGDTPPRSGVELPAAIEPLVQEWGTVRDSFCSAADQGARAPAADFAAIIARLDEVVHAFNTIDESVQGNRSALALGDARDTKNPTAVTLRDAVRYFERYRHPQKGTEGWPTSNRSILPHLEIVESVIEGRIGDFFDIADDLHTLLAQANAQDESTGKWAPPSKPLFNDAMSRIGDLQHRRIFFEELRNPAWAAKLLNAGAFEPPLARLQYQGDHSGYLPWAAGPYLVLAAPEAPEAVAAALRKAGEKASSYEVQVYLVKAAKALPADRIADLVTMLSKLPAEPLDPVCGLGLAEMTKILALGGHRKAAVKLGRALLRPKRAGEATDHQVTAGIESHWYGEALGFFVDGMRRDSQLLPNLVTWLEWGLRDEGVDPTAEFDLSYLARPSIGVARVGFGRNEITGHLTDAVRDVTLEDLRAGAAPDSIAQLLERKGFALLKRIERHVFAATLPELPDVLPFAQRCLLDRAPLDDRTTPREYFELARAALPLLETAQYEEWEELILSGPLDTPERRQYIRQYLRPVQTENQAWTELTEHWQLNHLGTIGAQALRGRTAVLLAELTAKLGDPTDPSPEGVRITRFGDDPERYLPELRGRTTPELLEFARAWNPPGDDRWNSASSDIGQAFATVVAEHAQEFSLLTEEVLTLPELFATRFLDGLRRAVDNGDAIAWEPLLAGLLRLPTPSPTTSLLDEEPRWHYQVTAALRIIENGLGQAGSGFSAEHFIAAIEFATRYVRNADSTPDNPASTEEIENDPVSRASNAVQPVAISTSVTLGVHAKSRQVEQAEALVERILDALDSTLVPMRVPASPIAAVFGLALRHLQWLAPEWVAARTGLLLSADWYGDVVASTALVYTTQIGRILDPMSQKLSELISRTARGENLDWNWTHQESVVERIGINVVYSVLSGDRDTADPLVTQFFQDTAPDVRGSVLGAVGHGLRNTEDVPAAVVKRAQELWDHRRLAAGGSAEDFVELSEFHAWVDSGRFPVEWWLPRLQDVAKAVDLEGITYLGKRLAEASATDSALALEVLDRLIRRSTKSWIRHDLVEHADDIIARAQLSGSEHGAEAARGLMDYLGRQGYRDINERVKEARRRLS